MLGASATACYLGCGDFYPYGAVHKAEKTGAIRMGVTDDYELPDKPSPSRGMAFSLLEIGSFTYVLLANQR